MTERAADPHAASAASDELAAALPLASTRIAWLRPATRPMVGACLAGAVVALAVVLSVSPGSALSWAALVVLAVFGYALAALLRNTTTLQRTSSEILVSHGPLPLLPSRAVALAPGARLEVIDESFTGGRSTLVGRTGGSSAVCLVSGTGAHTSLFTGLERGAAQRAVSELS